MRISRVANETGLSYYVQGIANMYMYETRYNVGWTKVFSVSQCPGRPGRRRYVRIWCGTVRREPSHHGWVCRIELEEVLVRGGYCLVNLRFTSAGWPPSKYHAPHESSSSSNSSKRRTLCNGIVYAGWLDLGWLLLLLVCSLACVPRRTVSRYLSMILRRGLR